MPGSMLSTSSVHSIVSFPPCLPSMGAPCVELRSESESLPPPPQPARTAPARASARYARVATRCMRFLPPAAPPGRRPYPSTIGRAGGARDERSLRPGEEALTRPLLGRLGERRSADELEP